ncbi:MAG: hypothetical protein M3422_03900 [Actinomycetota bacterium]|nr:hypothetical protein [Actinomycetota bacterium]
MQISNKELQELCTTLAELVLSQEQRQLLDNVLKIAWDFATTNTDLDAQFNGSFEPKEAEVIMAYHSATPSTTVSTSITRAPGGPSSITRATFETHSITRATQQP